MNSTHYKDEIQSVEGIKTGENEVMIYCKGIRPQIEIIRVASGSYDVIPGGQNGKEGINIGEPEFGSDDVVKIQIKILGKHGD